MSLERAKQRIRLYKRFARSPLPIFHDRNVVESIVRVKDVPNYQARATQKSEWLIGKKTFQMEKKKQTFGKKKKNTKRKSRSKSSKSYVKHMNHLCFNFICIFLLIIFCDHLQNTNI